MGVVTGTAHFFHAHIFSFDPPPMIPLMPARQEDRPAFDGNNNP